MLKATLHEINEARDKQCTAIKFCVPYIGLEHCKLSKINLISHTVQEFAFVNIGLVGGGELLVLGNSNWSCRPARSTKTIN